jgi:hypothetical protein
MRKALKARQLVSGLASADGPLAMHNQLSLLGVRVMLGISPLPLNVSGSALDRARNASSAAGNYGGAGMDGKRYRGMPLRRLALAEMVGPCAASSHLSLRRAGSVGEHGAA